MIAGLEVREIERRSVEAEALSPVDQAPGEPRSVGELPERKGQEASWSQATGESTDQSPAVLQTCDMMEETKARDPLSFPGVRRHRPSALDDVGGGKEKPAVAPQSAAGRHQKLRARIEAEVAPVAASAVGEKGGQSSVAAANVENPQRTRPARHRAAAKDLERSAPARPRAATRGRELPRPVTIEIAVDPVEGGCGVALHAWRNATRGGDRSILGS